MYIKDRSLVNLYWYELSVTTSSERVPLTKRFGTYIEQYLKWVENVKQVSASYYHSLRILRKLRNKVSS